MGELDGIDPPPEEDQDVVQTRTSALFADLIEPAKVTALDRLGEGRPAHRIATSWLRTKQSTRVEPLTP